MSDDQIIILSLAVGQAVCACLVWAFACHADGQVSRGAFLLGLIGGMIVVAAALFLMLAIVIPSMIGDAWRRRFPKKPKPPEQYELGPSKLDRWMSCPLFSCKRKAKP